MFRTFVILAVYLAFFLIILLWRRSRSLEERLKGYEAEQRKLWQMVQKRPAAAQPMQPGPQVEPSPAPSVDHATEEKIPTAAPPEPIAPTPAMAIDGEAAPPAIEDSPQPPQAPPPTITPPAPPAATIAASTAKRPKIDWEQMLGVRGAATAGGAVLALAALYFLRYSIEQGLIPPAVRVTIGFLFGAFALVASEFLRKRHYGFTANGIAGAGIVTLYAAIWSAKVLYALIPSAIAYSLMVLITAAGGILAHRHSSKVIAVLGLLGGLATPILLSSGSDRPIALFVYLLMLDTGVLVLARAKRWPGLLLMAMAGTIFYQVAWVFDRMRPEQLFIALAVLAIFAAFFVYASRSSAAEASDDTPQWVLKAQGLVAVVLPFVLIFFIAGEPQLGAQILPTSVLLAALTAAACWLAHDQGLRWLPLTVIAADLAILMRWMAEAPHNADSPIALAWSLAMSFVALAAIPVIGLEVERRKELEHRLAGAAKLALVGFSLLAMIAGLDEARATMWPWLAASTALLGLTLRAAGISQARRSAWLAAAIGGSGLCFFILENGNRSWFPSLELYLGVLVAVAVGLVALATRQPNRRQAASVAVVAISFSLAFLGVTSDLQLEGFDPITQFPAIFLLAILALAASSIGPSSKAFITTLVGFTVCQWAWAINEASSSEGATLTGTLACLAGAALFAFWPLIKPRLLDSHGARRAAALASPLLFLPFLAQWEKAFDDEHNGLAAIIFGAIAVAAAVCAQRRAGLSQETRRLAMIWYSAVALGAVSLALPLQVDEHWLSVGWAINALGLLLLYKRWDHRGLKYLGIILAVVVGSRLVLNPELRHYGIGLEEHLPILNWLLYTYLVPAAAFVLGAVVLQRLGGDEETKWLTDARAASLLGIEAIVVVFAWINLTIIDAFAGAIRFDIERLAARDLTLSLSWAVYALVLLGLGVHKSSKSLRWMSLGLLVLTIGKVFLFDLGELEDLYRVASLVGLALSLISVSLAYQRFVFSDREDS